MLGVRLWIGGKNAETSPAKNPPSTESTPQITASSRTTRLVIHWKSLVPTEPDRPPYSTPPSEAMAADSENTSSLFHVRLMPSVAHAAGLSDLAASRRPSAARRTATTPTAATANTNAQNTR